MTDVKTAILFCCWCDCYHMAEFKTDPGKGFRPFCTICSHGLGKDHVNPGANRDKTWCGTPFGEDSAKSV